MFDTSVLAEIAAALEKAADVAKAKAAQHNHAREFEEAGKQLARAARNNAWAKGARDAIAFIQDKPAKPRKAPGEDSEAFAMFWAAYPKKVGKGEARGAWKQFKCDAKLEQILRAVGRSRESAEWREDAGRFIPHPATWIRREGWSDELTAPAAGKRLEPADADPQGWREFLKEIPKPYEPFRFAIDYLKTDYRAWRLGKANE